MTGMRNRERSRAVIDGWRSFLDAAPAMTGGDGSGWAAGVYRRAVDEVPAYRAFLVEQGLAVDPAPSTDFADLPLVTKENYLCRFPLPSRCRGWSVGCRRHAGGVVGVVGFADNLAADGV